MLILLNYKSEHTVEAQLYIYNQYRKLTVQFYQSLIQKCSKEKGIRDSSSRFRFYRNIRTISQPMNFLQIKYHFFWPNSSIILFFSISSLLTQSGTGRLIFRVNSLIFSEFMLTYFSSGTHYGIGKTSISYPTSFSSCQAGYWAYYYCAGMAGHDAFLSSTSSFSQFYWFYSLSSQFSSLLSESLSWLFSSSPYSIQQPSCKSSLFSGHSLSKCISCCCVSQYYFSRLASMRSAMSQSSWSVFSINQYTQILNLNNIQIQHRLNKKSNYSLCLSYCLIVCFLVGLAIFQQFYFLIRNGNFLLSSHIPRYYTRSCFKIQASTMKKVHNDLTISKMNSSIIPYCQPSILFIGAFQSKPNKLRAQYR